MYKNEEEFLRQYNPKEYDQLSMTTDILILSISDEPSSNYRKANKKHMSVLLVKRDDYPFKDQWCLPGGFLDMKEDLDDAPKRILARETNLKDIFLEQLYTFGSVDRDPRTRVISTAYMALVDKNRLKYNLSKNASWFNVTLLEQGDIIDLYFDNEQERFRYKVKKVLTDATTGKYRYEILENNSIAFDHTTVILEGIERLKNKIEYTDIVFNMMPEHFTLGELQRVYEVILNKKLLDPAFRRIIKEKVEKTDKVKTGAGHRPSVLFKYKRN